MALLLTLRDGGARLVSTGNLNTQADAVETLRADATSCVVPVPGHIDAAIANSYLAGKYPTTRR